MICNKIFALLFVLCLVPQSLYATVRSVSHNVAVIIELQDNDEIELVDFPVEWGYSRIVLGLNSVPGVELSGYLVANDCYHKLHGFYEEFEVRYKGDVKITYHGPTQRLPVQWWVDDKPIVSSCESYSEKQRTESFFAMFRDIADSVYSDWTKNYKDLGDLNTETFFEGSSAKFKITHLPEWFYNCIYVQVESIDGRTLDGAVYSGAGGTKVDVDGYSSQFVLEQKTMLGPTFELAFPEYRKVRLKWWAEVQVPSKHQIEMKQKDVNSDSVEVEYIFDDNLYTEKTLKIVYDKRKLSDGKIPMIKKLSFNPYAREKLGNFGIHGVVYEIEAEIKPGDSVTIALPIDYNYQQERDSVVVEYFDEKENKWFDEPVDSVVDGYAYFNKPRASVALGMGIYAGGIGFSVDSGFVIERYSTAHKFLNFILGGHFLKFGTDIVKNGASKANGSVKWVNEQLKRMLCDIDIDIYGGFAMDPNWDVDQGTIDKLSIMQKGYNLIAALDSIRKNGRLVKLSDPYSGCNEATTEVCKWKRTIKNLDILLADAILSQFNPKYVNTSIGLGVPKYKFEIGAYNAFFTDFDEQSSTSYNYDDYFMVSSGLIEKASDFVKNVNACADVANVSGKIAQNYIDVLKGVSTFSYSPMCRAIMGFASMGPELVSDGFNCMNFLESGTSILDGHEAKLIAISKAMVRISLLAWLKKVDGFRNYALMRYKVAYDGIRAWLELAGPLLDYNNVVVKSYGSLALYEYMYYGTDENLRMVNGGLNHHYGDNGGYSEGAGYSQYVWDDLTYVLAALKDVYKSQNEIKKFIISEKFLKSPDYMFEFSRPVGVYENNGDSIHYGLIPVEVDDGVTYNPDYRVWAKLKDDPKYLAMSDKYPLKPSDGKINPLVAFGFPDINLYINSERKKIPNRGELWGDFKDGIGMITAVNGDDTVALSMIAESEKIWYRGQGHDQQDNLSITLTSSKKGFLIQDPGYSRFDLRSSTDKFHRYYDHNVLIPYNSGVFLWRWGQDDNRIIGVNELKSRISDFTDDFLGAELSFAINAFEMFSKFDYKYTVEGGVPATFLDRKINEPQNGVIGFTATTEINMPSTGDKFDNNRTIMYFGENFWVIDRPRTDIPMMWMANSPIGKWDNMEKAGLSLYGSWDGKLIPGRTPENDNDAVIIQNGARSDYENDNNGVWYLRNYKYTAFDEKTKTYVMSYSLGNETFDKDNSYCPTALYQCFVNTSKNMRVVVPPAGESFKLCDALPENECFGETRSTGITMFVKNPLGNWTTRWVLDGELLTAENASILASL